MSELRIYKPNKDGNGAASKFQVVVKEKMGKNNRSFDSLMCFLTMGGQTGKDQDGNASFGWGVPEKEIILKISTIDAASIISGLLGVEPEVKLFHQNSLGNTSLTLTRAPKGNMFYLRVAAQRGKEPLVELKHSITMSEAILLKIYLERFIGKFFD